MTDENILLLSLHCGIATKEEQKQASEMIEKLQDANESLSEYIRFLEKTAYNEPIEAQNNE